MRVKKGTTDVFAYFNVPAGATLTAMDLQYLRSGGTPSAKADATAGTVGAHSDNTAVYVDATDSPELLQVCFPDAAFATGVDEVILTVYNPAEGWQRDLRVELIDNTNKDIYDRLGPPAGASVSADIAAQNDISPSEVNAEMVDALNVDTYSDPAALAAPMAASLSLVDKVNWLFARIARNISFNKDTGELKIKNSAGTDIAKSTATDDGTTTTDGQLGAP